MGRVPCLRGLKIPVATVVDMVADGLTTKEILATFLDLEEADITEALRYGAEAVRERHLPLVRVAWSSLSTTHYLLWLQTDCGMLASTPLMCKKSGLSQRKIPLFSAKRLTTIAFSFMLTPTLPHCLPFGRGPKVQTFCHSVSPWLGEPKSTSGTSSGKPPQHSSVYSKGQYCRFRTILDKDSILAYIRLTLAQPSAQTDQQPHEHFREPYWVVAAVGGGLARSQTD